jgi:hypothetical protein
MTADQCHCHSEIRTMTGVTRSDTGTLDRNKDAQTRNQTADPRRPVPHTPPFCKHTVSCTPPNECFNVNRPFSDRPKPTQHPWVSTTCRQNSHRSYPKAHSKYSANSSFTSVIQPPAQAYPASLFLYCATLTEVFPCFFLSCKANSRV